MSYVRGNVLLQGKGKMVTYWLSGERTSTANKFEPTPIPTRNKNVSLCSIPTDGREAYALCNAKALNITEDSATSGNQSRLRDEADVPLLSITSPPDGHSHV